jgi:hypothetical protein
MEFIKSLFSNNELDEMETMLNNLQPEKYNDKDFLRNVNSFINFMHKFSKLEVDTYISFEVSLVFIIFFDILVLNNCLFPLDYYFKACHICLMGFMVHALLEFTLFAFDECITCLYNKYIKEPLDAEREKYE